MPTTEPTVTFDVDSEKIKRCTNQIFELSQLLRDIDALDEALRITAEKTSDILNAGRVALTREMKVLHSEEILKMYTQHKAWFKKVRWSRVPHLKLDLVWHVASARA